jgi:hypothetical protein
MRALLLLLATIGSAVGQIDLVDLATTGNGGAAYLASAARIYRIDTEGLQLYLERPRIDLPPPTGVIRDIRFTNYSGLFGPQTSRDGNVVAVTGARSCYGIGPECANAPAFQTTITGLPEGTIDVTGAGRISGNGRYLLIYSDGSLNACTYVVDLQNGPRTREKW